mgnify:CR=1 FL=1
MPIHAPTPNCKHADLHYQITYGPHQGQCVDASQQDVLTLPGGHVILPQDATRFLSEYPHHEENLE